MAHGSLDNFRVATGGQKTVSLFKATTLGAACALVLIGAGKPAVSDPAGAARLFAEATYLKGYKNKGFSNASNQFYTHALDNTCQSAYGGARFAPLSGKQKTVQLQAGRRTIIFASTNNIQGSAAMAYPGGVAMNQSTCINKGAFTPQAGAKYQIVQRRENAGPCRLEITDLATGAVPADYEDLPPMTCYDAKKDD